MHRPTCKSYSVHKLKTAAYVMAVGSALITCLRPPRWFVNHGLGCRGPGLVAAREGEEEAEWRDVVKNNTAV